MFVADAFVVADIVMRFLSGLLGISMIVSGGTGLYAIRESPTIIPPWIA